MASIRYTAVVATVWAFWVWGSSAGEAPAPPVQPPAPAVQALLNDFKDLGAPDPERRKAAQEKVKQAKLDALPVLLAMLHPKQGTDEFTRIGVLRALVEFAPLTEQGAQTLAWAAAMDTHLEVRREACAAIRQLQEDRATREVIKYGFSQDPAVRRTAAAALRELDDSRVLASLIRAVPIPSITANMGEPVQQTVPALVLPVGPGGTRLPIFLPQQPVTGIASDIGGPVVDLLKQIAGKDLGSLPYGWNNWLHEKNGDIGAADRNAYRENRPLRERMNAP
ncbi:MAG: HEAT repeat domain-containing protein [Planctomycetota bacterium]|nr:HEAT repeat domain-containing protein [Planctomycetota bacterium]